MEGEVAADLLRAPCHGFDAEPVPLQEQRQKLEMQLAREQEERLAAELQSIQLERTREERLRQQLRQTDPELRGTNRHLPHTLFPASSVGLPPVLATPFANGDGNILP